MEKDIVFYHKLLQKSIRAVEKDETNTAALEDVREAFGKVFEMMKMIMISKKDRYYGCFLMNFELVIDYSGIHEAGVNIDAYPFQMTVNPLLLGLNSLPEMMYKLCHEIEHIVLNHPTEMLRANPANDPAVRTKLNIAMDASINDRLSMEIKRKDLRVLAEPPDIVTSGFLVNYYKLHFKEMQAYDYYYEHMPDDAVSPKGLIIIIKDGFRDQIITAKKRKGMVSAHFWTETDSPEDVESLIRKFISDVYNGMPGSLRANLPDHQKEALDRLLAPPAVSWKYILKRYIGTIPYGHKKTRTRLSRRQPERYDISGRTSSRLIKLIIAIDTSGSMSKEMLESVFTEIFGIIGTRMCEATIIECDAKIQRIYKAHSFKDVSLEVSGRGGTSYIPVIEYINANRRFRDAVLVYFTDGMGDISIPRPLTYKTLWVLHDNSCELSVRNPYGEVLVMN